MGNVQRLAALSVGPGAISVQRSETRARFTLGQGDRASRIEGEGADRAVSVTDGEPDRIYKMVAGSLNNLRQHIVRQPISSD